MYSVASCRTNALVGGEGGANALGGGKKGLPCFPLWICSALSTEHRVCGPGLGLLLWQFQVSIKNIWNH